MFPIWTIPDRSYQYLPRYLLLCLLPPPSSTPCSLSLPLCCVCVTCLCGNPRWWWLRPCHWFRWHICHTHVCQQLLLLRLVELQGKASLVDFLTGWLICLSGYGDPWPRYHLLPLSLRPVNVTLASLTAPHSSHTLMHAWLPGERNMERSTLATVGLSRSLLRKHPQGFCDENVWRQDDLTVTRESVWRSVNRKITLQERPILFFLLFIHICIFILSYWRQYS